MRLTRIALVEDDRDQAELTMEVLTEGAGHPEITWLRDGAEALDYLFQRGKYSEATLPQLLLLDLKLPKVRGMDVLRQLRANPATARLPVVVFTSSKEERDLIESYHLGVNSYIQKPVDFEEFQNAVGRLGLYWFNMNQYPPEGQRA